METLRQKKLHGSITEEEESNVVIPNRATRFNEHIIGLGDAVTNVQIGSDFEYGKPRVVRDPVPLVQRSAAPEEIQ